MELIEPFLDISLSVVKKKKYLWFINSMDLGYLFGILLTIFLKLVYDYC